MKIYHTETQADYDALMVELESDGVTWRFGALPTKKNNWKARTENMCVAVSHQVAEYGSIDTYLKIYPDTPITKYKAKVDEKMKFTKENVLSEFKKWRDTSDGLTTSFYTAIDALDETPEKVVVKKFVAEFYEECENATLKFLITQLEATDSRSELGEWYRSCRGRHRNGRANAQETIAKMKLDGYEVEKEPLYYIPLPHLETSDGIQQVLSKRKGDKNYFASRPNDKLKQRFTKEELAQVPEIYKLYATLIEEEEE